MVLGTPGSGKTEAILCLLKILTKMRQRVLLVSYTNQAIDNVLLRLLKSGFTQFARITQNKASIDEELQPYVYSQQSFDTIKQYQNFLENNYIFGATCLQGNNQILQSLKFDYCVMDEASQIAEPLVLGPVMMTRRFVMIGDYYQLNPLVKSTLADKKGMGVSLFERLCKLHPQCMTLFKKQYRMCADILELSNSIIYHGVMQTGNQQIAEQTQSFPTDVKSEYPWLETIKQRAVTLLETDEVVLNIDLKERQEQKYTNEVEAAICKQIVDNFVQSGVSPPDITVISPFLAQQVLLKSRLNPQIKVLTIDKA